ncbi:hypothetical protein F5Y03DRAFT_369674 [Xylaria venustula]|nr:hypothetical protein F5Y03DRAFT_369674 [Xylaria venustula]
MFRCTPSRRTPFCHRGRMSSCTMAFRWIVSTFDTPICPVYHNDRPAKLEISTTALPLATIVHEPFSRSASITLPARPGSRHPATRELLESVGAFTRILRFGIETTAGRGRGRREYFEWRHSSGAEVEALEGRPYSGWKLVRVPLTPVPIPMTLMATALRDTAIPISPRPRPRKRNKSSGNNVNNHSHDNQSDTHPLLGYNNSGGSSSSGGGKEVVAVCAGTGMSSVTKVLHFRFLGAGADGSLGDRWAIMAVASALTIWNRDRRSRSAVPAAASAGF